MYLITPCHKVILFTLLLGVQGLFITLPRAVTIEFSAVLMPGTCELSLSQSTLDLGTVPRTQLTAGKLLNIAPFHLDVNDCSGSDALSHPMVRVSGEGVNQGGKWLFRSSDSVARGVGIMLARTDSPPNYNHVEVENNDYVPLGGLGSRPEDQSITFYAGITCGNGPECASIDVGELKAHLRFDFEYK